MPPDQTGRRRCAIKKRLCIIAFMAAVFLLSGATAAYLIYGRDLGNSFTVGTNTIDIDEDYRPPSELIMGENIFKKHVRVENTGSIPCYVRVFAEFSDSSVRDISQISPDGKTYYPASEYRFHLPSGWEYVDEDDELLGSYYYFTEPLEPKKKTPVLFDSVKTVTEDASQIRDFEIIVYAESVQTSDENGEEYESDRAWEDAWRGFLQRR